MQAYEIAFIIAVLFLVALGFIQVIMRQQVHQARFGNEEISPWNMRFSNSLFGEHGIWKLHRRFYQRSTARSLFIAASAALIASIIAGVADFLYQRYGR